MLRALRYFFKQKAPFAEPFFSEQQRDAAAKMQSLFQYLTNKNKKCFIFVRTAQQNQSNLHRNFFMPLNRHQKAFICTEMLEVERRC